MTIPRKRLRAHDAEPLVIRTQPEVAKLLGISRHAVDRAEQSAMRKLRQELLAWARDYGLEGHSCAS